MRWIAWALTLLSVSIASGCAATDCGGWRPINASARDALTIGTKRQIVEHNRFGARQCGWRP